MSNHNTDKDRNGGFDFDAIKWARGPMREKLSFGERALLQYLASRCDPSHTCYLLIKTISKDLQRSRPTIFRLLKLLKEKQLVSTENRGMRSSVFTLHVEKGLKVETLKNERGLKVETLKVSTCETLKVSYADTHKEPLEEPLKEVTSSADKPQGGISIPDQNVSSGGKKSNSDLKKIQGNVITEWENQVQKFQTTKPVLTAKDKKQLKDVTLFCIESDADPVAVIRKIVAEWDRFKIEAKIERGWSKNFDGGGLSPNPSTHSLLGFRKEAITYFYKEQIQAAADFESEAFWEEGRRQLKEAEKKRLIKRQKAEKIIQNSVDNSVPPISSEELAKISMEFDGQ